MSWHKTIRPHPRPNDSSGRTARSYEERGKSRSYETHQVAVSGHEKDKLNIPQSAVSRTQVQQKEIPKSISYNNITVSATQSIAGGTKHVESVKARNRDNGLTGFEIGLLNIIAVALLIFFGHIGYGIFVLGMFLIFLFLFISGLIYSFMGLNRQDKHRGLALLGILIEAVVLYALTRFA